MKATQEEIDHYTKMAEERGGSSHPTVAQLMAQSITDAHNGIPPLCKVTTRQRHETGRMNRTEAKHARDLDALKQAGEITDYWFEEVKFRLAKKTWYTPDFFVRMADGSYEVHEVKGFMEDDAAVKLKVAARLFPHFKFRLFYKGKEIEIANE